MMMKDADKQQDYGKEDSRLISLDAQIKAHPAAEIDKAIAAGDSSSDVSVKANQVLAQLIGAPLGAGVIGWLADKWLHTSPWILLAMLFLGFVVAMRNIYTLAQSRAGD